jgi:hypothetical protein
MGGHWCHSCKVEHDLQQVSQTPASIVAYWRLCENPPCQKENVSNPKVINYHNFKDHTALFIMPFVQINLAKQMNNSFMTSACNWYFWAYHEIPLLYFVPWYETGLINMMLCLFRLSWFEGKGLIKMIFSNDFTFFWLYIFTLPSCITEDYDLLYAPSSSNIGHIRLFKSQTMWSLIKYV